MRRVIYISHASRGMTEDKAAAIVEKSRRKNSALGLTGALVLQEGVFLQILEGPDAAVVDRLDKIAQDARHHSFTVLCDGPIGSRSYPDQPMVLLQMEALPEDARTALEEMFALEPMELPKREPRRLRDILPRFAPSMAA